MNGDRRAVREIVMYGLFAGALIALLRLVEYRYLVLDNSETIYAGIVAAIFAFIGLRLGQRIAKTVVVEKVVVERVNVRSDGPFVRNDDAVIRFGVTARELEILELIGSGLSNREIADKLFVSENTVKTHSSRLFDKLGAKRRTQAVQLGKQHGLIP